jgi:hypothetical protein
MNRWAIALVVAVTLGALSAPAEARKFRYTHNVTVSGTFVNEWTVDAPNDCGPVGGGTLSVSFQSKKPFRAGVGIDPQHASHRLGEAGSWTLLGIADSAGHISDVRAKPAEGTVNRDDRTTPRPRPADESPCNPPDRRGCGPAPLRGKTLVEVAGFDRRHIHVDLFSQGFDASSLQFAECDTGGIDRFSSPPSLAGGTREGELLLEMPSPAKLRRRRVVTVTGSSHKRTTYGDPGSETRTDDVTRTATVTFTRI